MDQEEDTQDELLDSSVFTIEPDEPQAPRLRTIHLLLWMLCAAPLMTVMKIFSAESGLDSPFGTLLDSFYLLYGIIGAAVLTGSLVLCFAWFRNRLPIYGQPGYCLLHIQSFILVGSIVIGFRNDTNEEIQGLTMLLYSGMYLLVALGHLLSAVVQTQRRWLVLFFVFFLASLLQCGHQLYLAVSIRTGNYWEWSSVASFISNSAGVGLLVCLLTAIAMDKYYAERRDWLHWTGIVSYLLQTSLNLSWLLAFYLLS